MRALANTTAIRRRLLLTLFIPAVAVLAGGTVADYYATVRPLDQAYDEALIDTAVAIAAHTKRSADGSPELTLPQDVLAVLRPDVRASTFFRVELADGTLVAGDDDLPTPTSAANPTLAETTYRGARVRLVAFKTFADGERITVTTGETTAQRDDARQRALWTSIATDTIVVGIIVALIWLSVRLSLDPLREIEDEIKRRSARDLSPLEIERVPDEIRGLIATLNRLFVTVGEHAGKQRQFLDNAAHQLRTPLAGIQAQLELMTADEPSPERQDRLRRVLDAARRLSRTAQQLLMLARADESASLATELADVDLASIVESTIADYVTPAEAAGIDLGVDIAAAATRGIDWLIAEALRNLLGNALAHTPRGGSVTVSCGVWEGAPYLEVTDTGSGIPAADRERIFGRFYRGSNARGSGSGLGLAIVKEVAGVHGASLSIDRGPGGIGTTVQIVFGYTSPVAAETESPRTPPANAAEGPQPSLETVNAQSTPSR
ncbi:MAG TPA: sensor histidine kinase [Gammaproteobacteria bacterium]|nr:sensor histidine kinase [Gammaproteobacteria bacterium]